MGKFQNLVIKIKGQGHIQAFFDIPSLRQKHDVARNVGLQLLYNFEFNYLNNYNLMGQF